MPAGAIVPTADEYVEHLSTLPPLLAYAEAKGKVPKASHEATLRGTRSPRNGVRIVAEKWIKEAKKTSSNISS